MKSGVKKISGSSGLIYYSSRKVQKRARIQFNITSQEDEDESSMIDRRKKGRRIG